MFAVPIIEALNTSINGMVAERQDIGAIAVHSALIAARPVLTAERKTRARDKARPRRRFVVRQRPSAAFSLDEATGSCGRLLHEPTRPHISPGRRNNVSRSRAELDFSCVTSHGEEEGSESQRPEPLARPRTFPLLRPHDTTSLLLEGLRSHEISSRFQGLWLSFEVLRFIAWSRDKR